MNYSEIEMEGMKEILRDKEEEIKKLKEIRDNREEKIADLEIEICNLKEERDNFMLKYSKAIEEKVLETNELCTERNKLEEEIKKLKSDLALVIKERDDNIEQNKKLKSDLAFKNTMLDNVKAEYESSQDVIKELKEERDKYYAEWHLRHS